LLTDNRDLAALSYSARLVELADVDVDKLAPLRPVGAVVGSLRPELAREMGLSASTRVFSGVNDTQAAAVGTATFRGCGALNLGTTSQVLAHMVEKKSDLEHALISMPSAIAGRYMVMAENGLGGKPLDHFLRTVVFASDELAGHGTQDMFAGIESAVASVAPGSDGLLFLPWLTGVQAPDSHAATRGGFLNLSLHTTRAHMVRSILEGVALNMRWVLPSVQAFVAQEFDELLFSGGAATSDAWSQILADVTGKPVAQLSEPAYVNNRAIAFLAFVALGEQGLDDIGRFCRIRRRYEPQRESVGTYDKLFTQFVAAFESNRGIFEALNG
jgi:xylulokinase